MPSWLRSFLWPLLFIAVAALIYRAKIEHEMVDFEVYRTAAIRALSAEPLYVASDGHYQFKYLPAFALAMAPFALVDRDGAKVIWFALSTGLLTAFVRWAVRGLPERRRTESALVLLTVLLMAKFYAHELTLGQANILLGSLLVGALLAVQVDLPHVAGVLLGISIFVKPYALLLLPWLAFTYSVGAALLGLGVVAFGLIVPATLYGWSANLNLLRDWTHTVAGTTPANLLGDDNISLAAMWAKWLGVSPLATALTTITIGAALGVVAIVWLRRQRVSNPDYLEFALLMLLVPLLSPQGWDYVLLLATPAVVCLLDRWKDVSPGWRVMTGVALATMGLTVFDLMGRTLYSRFMALSLVTVAAIGAAAALANLRRKSLA